MRKVLAVFGTRPEAIKLAPIIQQASAAGINVLTCTTGQHREMLDQVLDIFEIAPDYALKVMRPDQRLPHLTARIIEGVSDVVEKVSPDMVLVQGDTTTAFAAGLAAFYARVPVGHVEAGLRTFDLTSPFPEEAMRQMLGRIVSLHFAPTKRNAQNLMKEGVSENDIFVTGNTVIDALLQVRDLVRAKMKLDHMSLPARLLSELESPLRLVLITGHRRENFGLGLERVCHSIAELAHRFPDTLFVYPVHLNPNVSGPVGRILQAVRNVRLIQPVNYYTFVYLMERACVIISDSGGVQEEAPSLQRPVFVTRDNTERSEIVEAGAVRLVGTDPKCIVSEVSSVLQDDVARTGMITQVNPYGDGHAAERILALVAERLDTPAGKETIDVAVRGR